ncbi:MAG: hypothetical protein WCR72_15010 [Bacteroidota bacterium]
MNKSILFTAIAGILLIYNLSLFAQKTVKPGLKATISGVSYGDISKELLLNPGAILCSNEKYQVIYYNLSVLRKNGDLVVYNGRGSILSESMKAEIRLLEAGSKLIIEEIGAKSDLDKIIKLPAIEVVIK